MRHPAAPVHPKHSARLACATRRRHHANAPPLDFEKEHNQGQMPNPNDAIRDAILRHLYSVHSKARSPKSAGLKITELGKALKPFKLQEVGSNLDYLVQKGWVREVIEKRMFTTPKGTTQQAEKRSYKISDLGIDRLEAASIYLLAPAATHINVTNIRGVTVVGEGNVVNTTFADVSRALSAIRQATIVKIRRTRLHSGCYRDGRFHSVIPGQFSRVGIREKIPKISMDGSGGGKACRTGRAQGKLPT
jgi:hypothetical protein